MQDLKDWQNKFQECYCSNKLINKINSLNKKFISNKINLLDIKKAIYYANKYHGKQRKASGELHYCHPLDLACMAVDYLFEANIIIMVILQDIILEKLMTQQELSIIFNSKIANCLQEIAEIKNNKNNNFINTIILLQEQKKCCSLFVLCLNKLYSLYSLTALPEDVHKDLVLESLQAVQMIMEYLQQEQQETDKDIIMQDFIPILAKIKC